jgi:hypothetical protein
MTEVVNGIVFEKDVKTNKRYIKVDFDKYGIAIFPFLEQIGVIDHEDDFWKEYSNSVPAGELRQKMYKNIDSWQWNEK